MSNPDELNTNNGKIFNCNNRKRREVIENNIKCHWKESNKEVIKLDTQQIPKYTQLKSKYSQVENTMAKWGKYSFLMTSIAASLCSLLLLSNENE